MLLVLKLIFSKVLGFLSTVLEFAIKNWQVVVPALTILFLFWQWRSTESDLVKKTNELDSYVKQNETAAKVRDAENKAKELFYQNAMSEIRKQESANYAKLEGDFYALERNKSAADRSLADMRERLQRQLSEASTAKGLPEIRDRLIGLTAGGGDCDSSDTGQALKNYTDALEQACALTTQDYNTLYRRCDASKKAFESQ